MKISMRMALAAAMMLGTAACASAQTVGDWVLGNYGNGGYWYPGVIEKLQGGKITIRYDDGDREAVAITAVRPYDWAIGRKVECNFKNAGTWYPGKIASLAGERIGIAYDDGDKETTKTGRCRSK
jgi:Agenet domain